MSKKRSAEGKGGRSPKTKKIMKVLIRTDKLSKYYGKGGEIKALDGLDLEVYEGETFGLLGPNGAGKSTTVRMLNGIVKPTSGTASVNSLDIIKDEAEVKRITGLLAESPGLYEKLSAFEFLEFMGALYDVPGDILHERIDNLLKLFGLHDRRNNLLEGYCYTAFCNMDRYYDYGDLKDKAWKNRLRQGYRKGSLLYRCFARGCAYVCYDGGRVAQSHDRPEQSGNSQGYPQFIAQFVGSKSGRGFCI